MEKKLSANEMYNNNFEGCSQEQVLEAREKFKTMKAAADTRLKAADEWLFNSLETNEQLSFELDSDTYKIARTEDTVPEITDADAMHNLIDTKYPMYAHTDKIYEDKQFVKDAVKGIISMDDLLSCVTFNTQEKLSIKKSTKKSK
jgi:hypothetical protein